MAAVAQAAPRHRPTPVEPRLRLVTDSRRDGTTASERVAPVPAIGAARRRSPAGKTAAAAVSVAALVGLWFGTGALATSPHPASTTPAVRSTKGLVYIVKPGDTLWSIATTFVAKMDPATVVDRLRAELHGSALTPGTVLRLP